MTYFPYPKRDEILLNQKMEKTIFVFGREERNKVPPFETSSFIFLEKNNKNSGRITRNRFLMFFKIFLGNESIFWGT